MEEITEEEMLKYERMAKIYFPTIFNVSSKFILKARYGEITHRNLNELVYHHQLIITYIAALLKENPEVHTMHTYIHKHLTKQPKQTTKAYYDFTDGYLYDNEINYLQIMHVMDSFASQFVLAINEYHERYADFSFDYFQHSLNKIIEKVKRINDQPNSNISSKEFIEIVFVKALERELNFINNLK